MAGQLYIDFKSTYQICLLLSVAVRTKFGTDVPDVAPDGQALYLAQVAVTYTPEPGQRVNSEVIDVTIVGGDRNHILNLQPGTPVTLDRLRQGVSAPEQKSDGRGGTRVVGGKPFYRANAITPFGVQRQESKAA